MDHQSRLTSATAVLTFTSTSCTRSPFQTLMHTIFRVIFLNQRCGKIFLLLKNLKCIHNVLRIKPRLLSTILGPFSVVCPARTPFLCQTLSIPTSVFAFLEAGIFGRRNSKSKTQKWKLRTLMENDLRNKIFKENNKMGNMN